MKCQRSFVLCLCIFIVITNEEAESFVDAFTGGLADIETLSQQCTCVMLNTMDDDFVTRRADDFMRLLRTCLDSGQHLRCTAKKSADSALCHCGVKVSLKPFSKNYTKLYKSAHARSERIVEGVHFLYYIIDPLYNFNPFRHSSPGRVTLEKHLRVPKKGNVYFWFI